MVSPVKRGLQRVDTKAEFNTVLDVDGEEEEEDGEEEEAIGLQLGEQQPNPPPPPAATQEPTAAVAGAAAQQEEQQQQQPPPEGAVAPPASLPVSSDPGPGSKPLAPLPPQLPPPGVQPRAILKKTSSYALPPQMNGNGSSGATSGSQPPPIPMPKKWVLGLCARVCGVCIPQEGPYPNPVLSFTVGAALPPYRQTKQDAADAELRGRAGAGPAFGAHGAQHAVLHAGLPAPGARGVLHGVVIGGEGHWGERGIGFVHVKGGGCKWA